MSRYQQREQQTQPGQRVQGNHLNNHVNNEPQINRTASPHRIHPRNQQTDPQNLGRSPRQFPNDPFFADDIIDDERVDPLDPLAHMRSQFGPTRGHHRPFFQDADRGWPDAGFRRPPMGFDDFDRDFPQQFRMAGFPNHHFYRDQEPEFDPRYYEEQPQQQPGQHQPADVSPKESRRDDETSHRPKTSTGGTSIPIRVIHEKTYNNNNNDKKAKHPLTSRNTTELPAKSSVTKNNEKEGSNSPRLERAHSEPPKAFQQRMFHLPKSYTPIPEGGIPQHQHHHSGPNPNTDDGLKVPRNLATSASAPSVPQSQETSQPTPPPRSTSNKLPRQENENLRKQSAPPTVRQIPIYVEGRDVPVSMNQNSESALPKPSDYYPSGTSVKKGQGNQQPVPPPPPPQRQQQVHRDLPLNINSQRARPIDGEPTSPISPPPGPIPMGCSELHMNIPAAVNDIKNKRSDKEPCSPLVLPEGPIPLPCSEEYLKAMKPEVEPKPVEPKSVEKKQEIPVEKVEKPEVTEVKIDVTDSLKQKNENPENPQKPKDPALLKLEKVKSEVKELMKKIEDFKGSKKDKEYLYLDEMLTRHLLVLDGVETGGRDDIRQMRKESIQSINRCLSLLDVRAADNKAKKNNNEDNKKKTSTEENKKKMTVAEENNAVLSELAEMSENEKKNEQ